MEQANPALPYQEIDINGQKLKMVFTYGALANAEDALHQRGYNGSLIGAMLRRGRTLSSLRVLFAMSLYAYQPEIEPNEAQEWVTPDNLVEVLGAVDAAWQKNVTGDAKAATEGSEADPSTPSQ